LQLGGIGISSLWFLFWILQMKPPITISIIDFSLWI
jgi:hypothetical protein